MYYKGMYKELNEEMAYFSHQLGLIVGLETNGKITTLEAYKKIKTLWKELKHKKKEVINNEDEQLASSGRETAEV